MLRSTLNSWREYLTPAYHTSTFSSTGEITPEEFVEAGDYLTYKFPTWQWLRAPASKQRSFLPEDKQVLVTRRVPSLVRAEKCEEVLIEEGVDEDGWTTTLNPQRNDRAHVEEPEIEEIDDLVDETAEDNEDDEEYAATCQGNSQKRFYDLYIYYSTAYRVPRMYLVGYDANGTPLTPKEMFEDISADYRDKTVTIEKAPFLNDTTTVSIHPCRHSAVMKVLINRAIAAAKNKQNKDDLLKGVKKLGLADNEESAQDDEWEQLDDNDAKKLDQQVVRVDQYLVIFLKFITSVTPGIEHDYTMDAF
jgi:ubiquitin-like-conjugating enzyme ATG3